MFIFNNSRLYIYPAILSLFLSVIVIVINFFGYNYPGNNYFPPHVIFIGFSIILMYVGFLLQFGRCGYWTTTTKELLHFFGVMLLLALATNAVQYTPFTPIDRQIVNFEILFHINMSSILAWTNAHAHFKKLLEIIYDTLPYQMCYLPIIVIASRRISQIQDYYFFLLVSCLLGFSFYYFFPTTAPASILKNSYFTEAQQATGLKFAQIHDYKQPTTLNGGMIAFPSFHVIWAWFCVYLMKDWFWVVVILFPVNFVLVLSCVLLGWHYLSDVVAGGLVIIITHGIYYLFCRLINHSHTCTQFNSAI